MEFVRSASRTAQLSGMLISEGVYVYVGVLLLREYPCEQQHTRVVKEHNRLDHCH